MAEFDYKLQHIPGKDNVVADALSRRADHAAAAVTTTGGSLNALRSILKKHVTFETSNRYGILAAARAHTPEPREQRQRNLDAATTIQRRAGDTPHPNKGGTIMTPRQRCSADTNGGRQCAQRTAVAHLCWNHLQRDMGVRVRPSSVQGAGPGLFAAWHDGLAQGHRIPYTGDEIALGNDATGGRTCCRRSVARALTRRVATAAWAVG
jgi:hypothetical protein